ncbi:hypothetical protein [Actinoplanes sp. NBRC 103695]|uniref:hypothetical protein n=1 Tax=Actinoplanes sp. NBRC 103695 TaxID=3032202 RepID=UPI0025554487|nr:hypothetical protein [Actinoplanes sp. NBRC 103695]
MAGARDRPGGRATLTFPFVAHILVVLVGGILLAAVIVLALWQVLGRPQIPPQAALSSKDLLDNVKLSLSVVAGVGGLVALVVAYRKQRLGEADHLRAEAAARREDTKLYNDRFRSSAEQLGADKAAVRLAGVYAMQELADDWSAGRQMCVDVLCAYLRMPFSGPYRAAAPELVESPGERPQILRSAPNEELHAGYQELQVRLAIHRVLRTRLVRRTEVDDDVRWAGCSLDLSGAHLADVDLKDCVVESIRAEGAVFHGRASFFGMRCLGDAAFGGSVFAGNAGFSGAVFGGNADFSGIQAVGAAFFVRTTFTADGEFNQARFFAAAVFEKAECVEGDLYLTGARFDGRAVFSETRFGTDALSVRFIDATLGPHAAVIGLDGPWQVAGRGFVLDTGDPDAASDE